MLHNRISCRSSWPPNHAISINIHSHNKIAVTDNEKSNMDP